jgi:cell filamentation protein
MSKSENRYHLPKNEAEVLPNLLGLTTAEEIGDAEFEGFYNTELIAGFELTAETTFNLDYIYQLHKNALSNIYDFAGQLRTVNTSKGGFLFPAAQFLPSIMSEFQTEILQALPHKYSTEDALIKDITIVHGELLFIHPFREGNGRTARTLANMMARKQGYHELVFDDIINKKFDEYVRAVQLVALKDYKPMEELIRTVFSF